MLAGIRGVPDVMKGSIEPDRDGGVTALLREAAGGNKDAFDRLLPLVYEELKRLARSKRRAEQPDHTLNTTALVHEAYFRLVGQTRTEWRSRHQFFSIAAEAMRRILVDYAKHRRRAKRGGGQPIAPVDAAADVADPRWLTDEQADEVLALDGALRRLASFNPRGAQVVQYRFFAGLTPEEVGAMLGTSERTVRRSWTAARAWLRRELQDELGHGASLLGFKAAPAP
jgi:RNA polymerase sigma factor (TIGR02999 family)